MIEIRVPKEIKHYKSKLFFGMSVRQCVCFGAALGICVPLYVFGKKYISEEVVSWLVILIASPLMLMGFFTYNGMTFEVFAKEWLLFYFLNVQRRKYEYEPIYMDIRKYYLSEELKDEIEHRKEEIKLEKKNKKHTKKRKKNKNDEVIFGSSGSGIENESEVDEYAKEKK